MIVAEQVQDAVADEHTNFIAHDIAITVTVGFDGLEGHDDVTKGTRAFAIDRRLLEGQDVGWSILLAILLIQGLNERIVAKEQTDLDIVADVFADEDPIKQARERIAAVQMFS